MSKPECEYNHCGMGLGKLAAERYRRAAYLEGMLRKIVAEMDLGGVECVDYYQAAVNMREIAKEALLKDEF